MARVVVENLAEHVELYEYHSGKHYPDGISHHFGVAGMAAKQVALCSGHTKHCTIFIRQTLKPI